MLSIAQPHLEKALRLTTARQRVRDQLLITPETFAASLSSREAEIAFWLTEGQSNVTSAS